MSRESLPFYVAVKDRYRLNQPGSLKETYHIVLDLKNIPLEYEVGDCIGIYPFNNPLLVERILSLLQATGEEIVHDRNQVQHSLRYFLEKKANLSRCNKKFLDLLKTKTAHPTQKVFLETLLNPLEKDPLRLYLEEKEIFDVLLDFSGISLAPQEFCDLLPPMMPRFYSIASSRHAVGSEVHLTVAVPRYQLNNLERVGVCSHFLCHLTPLNEPIIPIFLHKAREFALSEKALESPLIMIGPGTGVAPFRGFMQERTLKNPSGKNWLFFGERHRAHDFYYEDYWTSLIHQKKLRLDVAFSRDQSHKVYVQHKMLEQSKDLWAWIQEGAFLFVCGDASRMAKDVEATLLQIIQEQGNKNSEEASSFLKELRREKRYLKDVY